MENCTRCGEANELPLACEVAAFNGDRSPARALLCTPCRLAVVAGKAIIARVHGLAFSGRHWIMDAR